MVFVGLLLIVLGILLLVRKCLAKEEGFSMAIDFCEKFAKAWQLAQGIPKRLKSSKFDMGLELSSTCLSGTYTGGQIQ